MMKVMQTRPVPEMQATGTKIDKSRMMGDYQVRFCERVRLKCRALLDPRLYDLYYKTESFSRFIHKQNGYARQQIVYGI